MLRESVPSRQDASIKPGHFPKRRRSGSKNPYAELSEKIEADREIDQKNRDEVREYGKVAEIQRECAGERDFHENPKLQTEPDLNR